MNKIRIYKILGLAFSVCLIFTLFKVPVQAAGASVSASAGQIYVGESVTFTVSGSGAGMVSVSGAVNDSVWLENSSKSYTVTATAPGVLSVSISGVLADFATEQDVPVSGGFSVQVLSRPTEQTPSQPQPSNPQETPESEQSQQQDSTQQENTEQKSEEEQRKEEEQEKQRQEQEADSENDLRLASLSVSKGTLNPDFSSDTYNYDVVVDENVQTIELSAEAIDSAVNVQGIGKKKLKETTNVYEINCSSEKTDRVATYTVTVHKRKKGMILKNTKDKEFEVVQDELPEIEGFSEYSLTIDQTTILARKNDTNGLVLVYCYDDKQEKNYYIYDEKDGVITSIYRPVSLFSRTYVALDNGEDLSEYDEFKVARVQIDGQELDGWEFTDKQFKDYSIVYLMDDKGETSYYQYEASENTLQKYSNAAAITQDKYQNQKNKSTMVILMMMATISVLLACGIALIFLMKKVVR